MSPCLPLRGLSRIVVASFAAPALLALAACTDTKTHDEPKGTGGATAAAGASQGSGGANTSSGGANTSSGGANTGTGGTGTGGTGAGSGSGGKATSTGGASSGGAGPNAGGAGPGSGGATGTAFHCPAGPFGSPVPSAASADRVDGVPPADAFNDNGNTRTNVEGAVWISDKLYVSEFPFTPAPTSRVLAIAPGSGTAATVSVAIATSGANGLAVDSAGNLIATDHKLGALLRIPFPVGTTTPTTLVGAYDGKRFNSPNDLAIRSDGNIYFSDPNYQAPNPAPQSATRVYRLAPGATDVTVIDANRSQPNGVTLSADERTLYVSGSDGIFSYPVQTDGTVGAGTRMNGFTAGGSDGMAMDCAGNLYATAGKRIVVLSPTGMEIGSVAVSQAESVTNVAFGGADHKTLFITSMGTGTSRGVFRATLNVPGFPY